MDRIKKLLSQLGVPMSENFGKSIEKQLRIANESKSSVLMFPF